MRYSTIFFKKDSGEIILVLRNTYVRAARQVKRLTGLKDVSNISFLYFPHDLEIDPQNYYVSLENPQAPAQLFAKNDVNIAIKLTAESAKKNIEKFKHIKLVYEGGTGDYIMESDVVAALCKTYPDKTFTLLTDPTRHCLIRLMLPEKQITLKTIAQPAKTEKNVVSFSKITQLGYYLPPYGKTSAYATLAGLDPGITPVKIKVSKADTKKTLAEILPDPTDRKKRIIGLHTTSGNNNAKSWPVDQAKVLIEKMLKIDSDIIFLRFGGHGEQEIGHESVKECIGRPWDKVAALVNACDLLVTIDSAIMHIAIHLGKPAVTLWGPLRPQHILPIPFPVSVVHGTCDKLFCGRYECNLKTCMKSITPDMIIKEVKKIWKTARSAQENIQ